VYRGRPLFRIGLCGTNRVSSSVRLALGVIRVAEIRLQEGESLENALRRFKRKVQTEDIIKDVKRHSYYLKPGEKRRVKQALARKRARKKIRKEHD
jgi:small subunit ribosomal protein S21